MGADGNDLLGAARTNVSYNASMNEYYVVWHGDDDTGALADDELEIYAQRFVVPVTLRFTSTTLIVAEDGGSIQIEVQL